MKIGIRAHDVGTMEKEQLSKAVNDKGFSGIQLVLHKAYVDETGEAGTLNDEKVHYIKNTLNTNGVEVAMLGAYFNPIHSNMEVREKAVNKFKEHIKFSKSFGTDLIGTETGSYNDDEWTYNPKNHTNEALDEVIEVFRPLVKEAEKYGVNVAIEPVFNHVVCNPEKMKYVLDKLDSSNVKVVVDLLNLVDIKNGNEHKYKEILDECITLFGDKIGLFHFKNFTVNEKREVSISSLKDGYFDYKYIMNKLAGKYEDTYCIFEDLVEENIDISKKYIDSLN